MDVVGHLWHLFSDLDQTSTAYLQDQWLLVWCSTIPRRPYDTDLSSHFLLSVHRWLRWKADSHTTICRVLRLYSIGHIFHHKNYWGPLALCSMVCRTFAASFDSGQKCQRFRSQLLLFWDHSSHGSATSSQVWGLYELCYVDGSNLPLTGSVILFWPHLSRWSTAPRLSCRTIRRHCKA